jgi:CHASE3 domain sensor protein
MGYLSELIRLTKTGNRTQAEDEVKGGTGAALMTQIDAELRDFSQEEERLAAERGHLLETSWRRLTWLLVAGTAAAILLASMLTLLFSGDQRGLRHLRDSAISLAAGKELAPLASHDEIPN